jgi:hypothetical protein
MWMFKKAVARFVIAELVHVCFPKKVRLVVTVIINERGPACCMMLPCLVSSVVTKHAQEKGGRQGPPPPPKNESERHMAPQLARMTSFDKNLLDSESKSSRLNFVSVRERRYDSVERQIVSQQVVHQQSTLRALSFSPLTYHAW